MIVYVIGVGMGNCITSEASEAISCSQCLIGAERMLQSIDSDAHKIPALAPNDIASAIKSSNCEAVSVLLSGDIGFYSGAKKLYELLEWADVRPICGISSVQYLCAKLRLPWEDMKLVSLHGRQSDVVNAVTKNKKCFFLTDAKFSPTYICERLSRAGLYGVEVAVGERLSYDDEKITRGSAGELAHNTFNSLSAVVTINEKAVEDCVFCARDDEFIRANTPMTKEEIRSIVLSKLALKPTEVAYDIGGGTGSVSVEMAQRCAKVYSVECEEGALGLMSSNRKKFGCYNMEIVAGKAPQILEDLPAPDAVFIGGSRGNMADIIRAVAQKKPNVRVVVTAIALETLSQAVSELSKYCTPSVVNICVSRNKKVGNYNMMTAENPIFIISGEFGQ